MCTERGPVGDDENVMDVNKGLGKKMTKLRVNDDDKVVNETNSFEWVFTCLPFVLLVYHLIESWKREIPKIYAKKTVWTDNILNLMRKLGDGEIDSYQPHPFLAASGHLATLTGYFRKPVKVKFPRTREMITMFDGGVFALDFYSNQLERGDKLLNSISKEEKESFLVNTSGKSSRVVKSQNIALLIHGVNGHSNENYMKYMANILLESNLKEDSNCAWEVALMTMRGCAELQLESMITYNAAFTADVRHAMHLLHNRFPDKNLYIIGFSLGGNLMIKAIAEECQEWKINTENDSENDNEIESELHTSESRQISSHKQIPWISGAVSISNPFAFHKHIPSLHNPPYRFHSMNLYSRLVAYELMNFIKRHRLSLATFYNRMKNSYIYGSTSPLPEELDKVISSPSLKLLRGNNILPSLQEVDRQITANYWGYPSLDHYLKDASSADALPSITIPLLCIQAKDDPLVSESAINYSIAQASKHNHDSKTIFIVTECGGHLGFSQSYDLLWSVNWAEQIAFQFLSALSLQNEQGKEIEIGIEKQRQASGNSNDQTPLPFAKL